MKLKFNKFFLKCIISIGVIILIVAIRLWYLDEQGNFHEIDPGELYRSAQMDRDELEYYIQKYNIHSILNLRGNGAGEPWYEEEITVSKEFNITHFDIGLSADKAPSDRNINELLNIFHNAPKPLLIHCKSGADRSGLAAAIWKVTMEGKSPIVAKRQLSILYGHMPLGPTQAMDDYFDHWVALNTK